MSIPIFKGRIGRHETICSTCVWVHFHGSVAYRKKQIRLQEKQGILTSGEGQLIASVHLRVQSEYEQGKSFNQSGFARDMCALVPEPVTGFKAELWKSKGAFRKTSKAFYYSTETVKLLNINVIF